MRSLPGTLKNSTWLTRLHQGAGLVEQTNSFSWPNPLSTRVAFGTGDGVGVRVAVGVGVTDETAGVVAGDAPGCAEHAASTSSARARANRRRMVRTVH